METLQIIIIMLITMISDILDKYLRDDDDEAVVDGSRHPRYRYQR